MIIGSHVQAKVQAKLVLFYLYVFLPLIEGFLLDLTKVHLTNAFVPYFCLGNVSQRLVSVKFHLFLLFLHVLSFCLIYDLVLVLVLCPIVCGVV